MGLYEFVRNADSPLSQRLHHIYLSSVKGKLTGAQYLSLFDALADNLVFSSSDDEEMRMAAGVGAAMIDLENMLYEGKPVTHAWFEDTYRSIMPRIVPRNHGRRKFVDHGPQNLNFLKELGIKAQPILPVFYDFINAPLHSLAAIAIDERMPPHEKFNALRTALSRAVADPAVNAFLSNEFIGQYINDALRHSPQKDDRSDDYRECLRIYGRLLEDEGHAWDPTWRLAELSNVPLLYNGMFPAKARSYDEPEGGVSIRVPVKH